MRDPAPRQTIYRDIIFRSRLEAKWAAMMDLIGIGFEYEPRRFKTDLGYYLPDFWLPEIGAWLELKPDTDAGPTIEERRKAQSVADQDHKPVFIVCGFPISEEGRNEALLFLPKIRSTHFFIQNLLWAIPHKQRLMYTAAALSAQSRLGPATTVSVGHIAKIAAAELRPEYRYSSNRDAQNGETANKPSYLLSGLRKLIIDSAQEVFNSVQCLKEATQ